MNRFENFTRPLMWLMALLIATLAVGCSSGSGTSTPSSAKAITAFSLSWTSGTPGSATGIINQTLKTIDVTVPYGTNVNPLFATFITTGASVTVGSVTQVNVTTGNDFSVPVAYKVTAADGTWATYTVIVTVSSSTAKAITTFTLADGSGTPASIGTVITGTASPFNIAVTMPYGTTDLSALVATFTTSGSTVKVGTTVQTSGTTPNDFSAASGVSAVPVAYVVTAADASTATYNVTVTVALSSSKAISAFSLAAVSGVPASTATVISGTASPYDIAVTMPNGTTDLSALVATFTTSGSSVKVGTTVQTSGTSQNDFSAASGVSAVPVAYVVTAADASTATYNVTVNVAAASTGICTGGASCVDLGNAGNFAIMTGTGITDVTPSPITGNIGTSGITGASITVPCTDVLTGEVFTDDANYPGFTCTSVDKTMAGLAIADVGTAYTQAAGKAAVPGSCPGSGAFDGTVVTPLAAGVYTCAVNVTIPTDFTLNGTSTDVWVFQITGKLTQSSATTVHLTGGALPENVFWQVSDVVEIGTTAHMEGVVLAKLGINMLAGSSIKGRLLSQTAVTLNTSTVTAP